MKKLQPNMGTLDAYVRLMLGTILVGSAATCKKHHALLLLLGSMKVAEGITRFCPCLHLMGKKTTCTCNQNGD